MDTGPIVHEYNLDCGVERAFDIYVNRIGEWWHPNYTANPETLQTVIIEPRLGGRVYASHTDLGDIGWGRVTVWEPPRRLVHTSTPAQSREHRSEVSVSFALRGDGCKFRFEHGGWNEHNVSDRKKFSDWPIMLDRFAVLANQSSRIQLVTMKTA